MQMKRYYSERKGLIEKPLKLSISDLREMFYSTYIYFDKKKAFQTAFYGIEDDSEQINSTIVVAPRMSPSPDVYFTIRTQKLDAWPIDSENVGMYDESTLFTVIEILYDHIGKYNFITQKFEQKELQVEFLGHINNILKFYEDGYYLEPTNGFVMKMPNIALKAQLESNCEQVPDDVLEKMRSATKSYYRFNADLEIRKKAICTLADILEMVREQLKEILNREYEINKNNHDKLIFEFVNQYNIRHNDKKQYTEYSRDIWYDWAMQYYTSVIIAYYKLIAVKK